MNARTAGLVRTAQSFTSGAARDTGTYACSTAGSAVSMSHPRHECASSCEPSIGSPAALVQIPIPATTSNELRGAPVVHDRARPRWPERLFQWPILPAQAWRREPASHLGGNSLELAKHVGIAIEVIRECLQVTEARAPRPLTVVELAQVLDAQTQRKDE